MAEFFAELGRLTSPQLAALVAVAGAVGAITSALITRFLVSPFLGARDRQDKEVEWRKHALELAKLDLERKLKTRRPTDTAPLRPSILDFLANYRDLQELGQKSPRELYKVIIASRMTDRTVLSPEETQRDKSST